MEPSLHMLEYDAILQKLADFTHTRAARERAQAIAARARYIIARLLEPAQAGALNQPKRVRQTDFLRAALSAAVGDALRI